ncbi:MULTISPECIES: restriction endonuclease subunit S [Aeromonas]|uniref:restriction endonuclease subunit S n=1 Tax=Aeromonas TaxID=642 RepID=UPI0029DA8C61|nr:restriction endonuclease subunit S [Aeromonas veronii]MDX7747910.1 restriction endonuclease subunit S [Aeromonas veronii]
MAEQMMQETAGKTIPAGYKQTEVGVIPKDWVVSSIGEVGELTSSKRIFESDYVTDGIPFYRGQEISALIEGKEIKNACFISKSRFHQLAVRYGAPQRGDILITAVGTLGNSFLVNVDEPFYFKDGNLIWLRNISGVFPGYLIRQLHFHKNEIVDNAIGSSQKALTIVVLKDFKFPLPINKQEQTAIANVLSDSDALIDALEQLIAKKQAIKSAAMQQLLTGRTRLPAFALRPDGTPKGYKPSELGEIPEDWEVMTYGEIFTFLSTSTNSRADLSNIGEYGYIHYGDIHTKFNNALDLNEFNLPRISSHLASSSFVENGDVIMADASEDYEGIGKSVEICNVGSKKVVAGLHTFLLRDKNKYMADGYRGYLHCIPAVKNAFDRLATGMKVYGLSKNNLAVVPVPVPSQKEQTAIATILSDMDNELKALTQKLDKARALKQGMMQQLLTGKIRLPLAAGA